jgi:hypothetical protein
MAWEAFLMFFRKGDGEDFLWSSVGENILGAQSLTDLNINTMWKIEIILAGGALWCFSTCLVGIFFWG